MDEISVHRGSDLSILDGLAKEAQYFARNAVENMIQLGRVLTEAKPLVKHGEWESWIGENAGCSVRYAQMFMQVYERFGQNPALGQVKERNKVFKLLALPKGQVEAFLRENDVSSMTGREVEEAVRKVREEMNAELRREREMRQAAEEKASAGNVPEEVLAKLKDQEAFIAKQQEELTRAAESGKIALDENQRLRKENSRLQDEIAEQEELINDTQTQYDQMRNELITLQSTAAKGDAERIPADELTAENFAAAVRQFVGSCARMPHMARTFATMSLSERSTYEELLCTVESWAQGARKALEAINVEEV